MFEKTFTIGTDASSDGLDGELTQMKDGKEGVIGYSNKAPYYYFARPELPKRETNNTIY